MQGRTSAIRIERDDLTRLTYTSRLKVALQRLYHLCPPCYEKRGEALPGGNPMREKYDFPGEEGGKFYHEAAEFVLPIYLAPTA